MKVVFNKKNWGLNVPSILLRDFCEQYNIEYKDSYYLQYMDREEGELFNNINLRTDPRFVEYIEKPNGEYVSLLGGDDCCLYDIMYDIADSDNYEKTSEYDSYKFDRGITIMKDDKLSYKIHCEEYKDFSDTYEVVEFRILRLEIKKLEKEFNVRLFHFE